MRAAVLILLVSAVCRGESSCPWLNAATAAGILGGEVKLQVANESCVFTHDASLLRIEVQTIRLPYKPDCGPHPMPLKAIGNEAVVCSLEEKNGEATEVVAGRVRERGFFVRVTSNSIARAALRDKARSVAEQVAGILF